MKTSLHLSFRNFYSKNSLFVFAFLLVAFATSAHDLYGVRSSGGADNLGTLDHYDPATSSWTMDYVFSTSFPGANPKSDLTEANGKFYGMTSAGGSNNLGVLFEWDPSTNAYTRKLDFDDSKGTSPYGALTFYNGKLYGMTSAGGVNGLGVIFEWDPITNIYVKKIDFNNDNGANPKGSFTEHDGKLYSMINHGGSVAAGVLIEYDPVANAVTKKIELNNTNGSYPQGSGSLTYLDGKFYGMTWYGGANGLGAIFEWDLATNVYRKRIDFNNDNGSHPAGSLTYLDGKFYGMTDQGSASGVLFEWDPATDAFSTKVVFDGSNGANPWGSLTVNGDKLYGMTAYPNPGGVIFEYVPSSNVFTTKIRFDRSTAYSAFGSLVLKDGKFYGMTSEGGNGYGEIFEWDPVSNLYSKKIDFDGILPAEQIAQTIEFSALSNKTMGDAAFNLHATASSGLPVTYKSSDTAVATINANTVTIVGAGVTTITASQPGNENYFASPDVSQILTVKEVLTTPVLYGLASANGQAEIGSLFKCNLDGSDLKSLYNFTSATSQRPIGSVVPGTDGFLYGMARSVSNDHGTIFKIKVDGSGYTELHNFNAYPSASSLIQTADGTLFGMTSPINNGLQGRLFKINTDGSGYQELQSLGHGGEPGFLMQASNGSIYGTDASNGFGNIFRMNADGSGYTVLHNFNGSDGSFAYGALMEATDGSLYGGASQGGPANIGTIYKINKDGTGFIVLHNFYLPQEGVTPSESLVQAPDGSPYLYGMTLTGGQYNSGVIYKINMTGDGYTVLHTFTGSDGARPACKLININNKLYGYTTNGGLAGGGVIFNYDLQTSSYHKLIDFSAATGLKPVFGGLLLLRLPATFDKPTIPASNISFSNVLTTSMTVSFTPGNGSQHLVVMKAGAPPTFKPADSTVYAMSQNLGNGETIVSTSNETTINVAELNQSTRYYFTVFESAKDSTGTMIYLTDNAPVASAETSASDFVVYKWNGISWDNLPGANAIRIAVDENGNPWVVNSNHDIYQYVNNAFIQRPGKANDIGIGGGQVWIIGVEPVRTDVDYKIYKWNGAGWDNLPGGGVRIAVDTNGQPWVTNSVKNIYRYVNNAWLLMPGLANDIGIGGGVAWVLGTNHVGTDSDFGIYRWNGSDWINLPGGGVNITADENGQPWVTNSVKNIYQFVNGAWLKLPGQANDIGVGGGKACIIGASPGANGITNFSLINIATNEVLSSFEDSVTVDLARVDFSTLVVRANTIAANLGSVSFLLDGVETNIDNNTPYQIKKSAFQSLSAGSHSLLANSFTKRDGKGFEEASRGAVITIINSSAITHFDVVNTAGVVLQELHDNSVINIANTAFKKITIVARVNSSMVGSVVFDLNDVHHIENIAPYAFNGDHNGYYKPWPFNVGQYLLQGTPYSKAKGKGKAGEINSLSFWIVNTDTISTLANSRVAEQESTSTESNELSLYPVPTRDEINVLPGSEKIIEVRIISTTGQVHFKSDRLDGSKLITISTSKIGLVSGMYFLQAINDKGKIVVKKLIKE